MKPVLPNDSTSFYPKFTEDAERLNFSMRAAGVGVWELNPQTNEVAWDNRCRELFGLAASNQLPYAEAVRYIHPDDLPGVLLAVQRALAGEDDGRYDMRYRTLGADDGKLRWVHFSGQAYFDEQGQAIRFGGIAQDITASTQALLESQRSLQQSESRFRSVISSAPAGIGLFVGRDLIIDMPNQVFIDIVGKGPDIAGKPLRDVLPELRNQPFLQILDDVYTTGKMFQSFGAPVTINQNGRPVTSYYNVTFSPLFTDAGEVYAILDISIDVSEAVLSRQKLEQAQKILQDAVELAKLATWSIDIETGKTEYSERMKTWLGVAAGTRDVSKGIEALPEQDRASVRAGLQYAMTPESGGVFDMEYGIVNQNTGRQRIIHSQARTFFDEQGKPLKVMGTALDITQQRNIRMALELEVQQRTEELDAANEELKATNEELQTINEELALLNDDLGLSNENLQQFAHVASHDLKEPVRKIKIFLGMIEADPETVLSGKTRALLQRTFAATDRMFSMINGVLSYSTINASGHPIGPVQLDQVISHVTHDLELLVEQKKASIKCGPLPEIDGAEILIYQLFYNLIINAIKFSRADTPPLIELTGSVEHKSGMPFAKITVSDNGMGFEPHQSEQIFNMFARLHSKDKYEGTGLGLALCQRIVVRHGGTINAVGQTGKGASFTVMLPLHQTHKMI